MSRLMTRSAMALLAGAAMTVSLAGCGTMGNLPTTAAASSSQLNASEATTLKKALDIIHKGVFARLDVDGNKAIDEYEAGPNLTLADFKKADKNGNHKLTYTEFKNYAVTSLFFFKDTPDSFAKRFRSDLGRVFAKLDKNHDNLLVKSEISNNDLKKLGLTFEYPRLGISVKIQKCTPEMFDAADKTHDGRLGQAEFEDFYLNAVFAALAPNAPAPTPDPAPDTPDTPVDPAPAL